MKTTYRIQLPDETGEFQGIEPEVVTKTVKGVETEVDCFYVHIPLKPITDQELFDHCQEQGEGILTDFVSGKLCNHNLANFTKSLLSEKEKDADNVDYATWLAEITEAGGLDLLQFLKKKEAKGKAKAVDNALSNVAANMVATGVADDLAAAYAIMGVEAP